MKKNKINSSIIKMSSLIMALALFVNAGTYALATDASNDIESALEITEKFVAESEYSVTLDSNGDTVIILTNEQQLSSVSRSGDNQYAKTTALILPSDETEAKDIIASIESLTRGSGSYSEAGWFYGSSVYLSSTIYYTTAAVGNGSTIAINSVTISCSVNSGTSISDMSVLMVQTGPNAAGTFKEQSKTYDALTTRTFYPLSTWVAVEGGSVLSCVGAYIDATAVRSSGQSTFRLVNLISS